MLTKFRFDPADVDTDGLADGLTGAGPWDVDDFVTGATPDGLAHQLNLTSTDDVSDTTFTLVGTDADDNAISEDVTGPAATTVETTKFFKTLTSVTASQTLGAETLDIGWVDEFVSPTVYLDWRRNVPSRYFLDVTGTINVDVDHSVADPGLFAEQSLIPLINVSASLLAETADSTAFVEVAAGYTAFRLQVNSYSSGAEVTLYVVQPEVS